MNTKILILGGSGLLGSYITKWCIEQGYKHIMATYCNSLDTIPDEIREGVQWKPLKLPDKEETYALVAGHDWVIHTAGYVSYNPKDKSRLLDTNTLGTSHVVNACLAHKISHLVYIGSISALGREKNNVTLNEISPWVSNQFSTTYGLSKYLGELEVWRGAAEGLNVSVILPSVILGTGNWKKSSLQMIQRIASESKWYPGGKTGFVDVRDIVSFIGILLQQSISGERWVLNGFDKRYEEIYYAFASHLGLQPVFQKAPRWLAKLVLITESIFKKNTLGVEMINQVYGSFSYDASKSKRINGFQYSDEEKTIKEISTIYMDKTVHFLPGL